MVNQVGSLSATSTNSAGKKVDEWVYHSPFGRNHRCVVKIFGSYKGMKFTAFPMKGGSSAQGLAYRADLEVFEPISDTDINRLRERVLEAYRNYDEVANGVKWSNWLEVVIASSDKISFGYSGQELAIQYKRIKKAVLPDGQELTVNSNDLIKPFPKPKRQGEEDPLIDGRWSSDRRTQDEYAYVPETEENLKVLNDMAQGVRTLHERVSDFVRTSNINGRLDLSSFTALPKPQEDV